MAERDRATPASEWAPAYLLARQAEGRRLPDELVAMLPVLPPSHPLASEWAQRADSAGRLVAYLDDRPRPQRVVDLGCGTGWLAARIAMRGGMSVAGVDATPEELAQARRVFGGRPGLAFVEGDIHDVHLTWPPDVVVLASVLQYAADPIELLRAWLGALAPGGELHVLDTPVYRAGEADAAALRSRQHYAAIGVPEMAAHYHHHTWEQLQVLPFDVLNRPDTTRRRLERAVLRRPRSPFPWLRFRMEAGR